MTRPSAADACVFVKGTSWMEDEDQVRAVVEAAEMGIIVHLQTPAAILTATS